MTPGAERWHVQSHCIKKVKSLLPHSPESLSELDPPFLIVTAVGVGVGFFLARLALAARETITMNLTLSQHFSSRDLQELYKGGRVISLLDRRGRQFIPGQHCKEFRTPDSQPLGLLTTWNRQMSGLLVPSHGTSHGLRMQHRT